MPDKGQTSPKYLHDIPLENAQESFRDALEDAGLFKPLGMEDIPITEGLRRVTARPIFARMSSPHYHAAAMDGYAIQAKSTEGASDRSPIVLHLDDEAEYVDTGDPLPGWADSVVPIELVELVDVTTEGRATEAIRLFNPVSPWSHVRQLGEDIVATELVLPAGHRLRPVDLGAIAACGYNHIPVARRPKVAIIPTGDELVEPGQPVRPGDIVESNSIILASQVEEWGGIPEVFPAVKDDIEQIQKAVRGASAGQDLVLLIAGSSAGSEDYSSTVIQSLGDILVHGIAVRPGHPVILGMLDPESLDRSEVGENAPDSTWKSGSRIPIIGVPGYPVSATLTAEIFVEPLISKWLGHEKVEMPVIEATLTRKVHSTMGDLEYLRVNVARVGEDMIAAPLSRGAGVISSLVRADGIVRIPEGVQGLQAGDKVSVHLYRTREEIERTILILGSHDLVIDLLAQHVSKAAIRLVSANLGSIGGLIAIRKGEAHMAGSHLLDPATGEYNISYIQKYVPDTPLKVIGFVNRAQGLILQPGNPKSILSLQDLDRDDVSFINRQRGAGTRLLLDYHLEQSGISPDSIRGYENEQYTHLAIAAMIAAGHVDCGLGIQAAAAALDLDFIPLFKERFDLIIPDRHYHDPKIAPLLSLLSDPEFQREVEAMPGYAVEPMGKIIAVLP